MAVKKIILKGEDLCIRKEGFANGVVTPGDLVDAIPGGDVTRQGAADTGAQTAFAYEREMTGDNIDVDYADSDTCLYAVCPPGVEVYANGAAAITVGAVLESAANGALQAVTTGRPVARALETIASAGRIKVEVL